MSADIFEGHQIVKTDERVSTIGRRFLRSRAEALAANHEPLIPSYHLRVEKVGFLLYEVAAYQNRLVPVCQSCGNEVGERHTLHCPLAGIDAESEHPPRLPGVVQVRDTEASSQIKGKRPAYEAEREMRP